MKAFNVILKILATLAAIAGIVYVIATYGDQIVAWAKKLLGCCCDCDCCCDCEECDDACEEEETFEEASDIAEEKDFA